MTSESSMSSTDLFDLKGKRALVTGAAMGIGRGCAVELAKAGADLVVNDRPGVSALHDVVKSIQETGRNCIAVESDVFSAAGCKLLTDEAIDRAGPIDILISNPAYGRRGAILDFPDDEFEKVVNATFSSGFYLSRSIARHMKQRGSGGKIIFISSICGEMPFENNAPYGAAKAALNHLTQSLAIELFGSRINVNAIEPGWIDTPNERATFSDAVIDQAGKDMPWGRMGTPADIGRAARFLASDAADYITGTVLPVDGGYRFKDLRAENQHKTANDQFQ